MFKPVLENADEITDFIVEYASDYIDVGLVRDYFDGCKAILKFVEISSLVDGDKNQNIRSTKKEKEYEKLPVETMPPLIVENGIVKDGNHRLRVAKRKKLEKIIIYDIVEIEEIEE